ncbi:arsenic transporter [Rhizobium sp. R72]|uniref:arsenic transporter n=1 Tax=unclassified Rhizobium TaxID=2613769 RepID=UPI000B52FFCC|nr:MULTISPECIES: arsenic transporter [unclassified Rhizobium]OWW04624.1 arsenic transporter [Rhizobium sp. R72]OWW05681.1 arsenic transporter [Rhizobium sp. R711]
MNALTMTWGIAGLTALGVITRPFAWPEAIWAVLGALLLVGIRLIGVHDAWTGASKGADVYFFLIGMMLLSELARQEGLFDWLASWATLQAKGSAKRLFVLIYGVGIMVTAFLSNDATAVVLTPAVCAACRAARVKNPMPYLLICAFIANAASFLLPISNPANLVIFGGGTMPPLWRWFATFTLPSAASIATTFLLLYWTQRSSVASDYVSPDVRDIRLSPSAKLAGFGLVATAFILLVASALDFDLGLPTFVAGCATTAAILLVTRQSPVRILKGVSWSVLPLVAGLFVVIEALNRTGLIETLAELISGGASRAQGQTAALAGAIVAVVSNLVNNLPAGLVAGGAVQAADVSDKVAGAILIGVDLGPNLSVTGSLATILWLTALRREGLHMGAWDFLKLGVIVMVPALVASLGVLAFQ